MSDLKKRLDRLEEEVHRAARPHGPRFPLLVFSRINSEPKPERIQEWLQGYEAEKTRYEAEVKAGTYRGGQFDFYRGSVNAKTCDGKDVSLKPGEYYAMAKEGRRIDRLSLELLEDWLQRHGFRSLTERSG